MDLMLRITNPARMDTRTLLLERQNQPSPPAVTSLSEPGRRCTSTGSSGGCGRERGRELRLRSDIFLVAIGVLPAEVAEAMLQATRVVAETLVPPIPRTEVRRSLDVERDEAVDLADVERLLPTGLTLTRDSEPGILDIDVIHGAGCPRHNPGSPRLATTMSYAYVGGSDGSGHAAVISVPSGR